MSLVPFLLIFKHHLAAEFSRADTRRVNVDEADIWRHQTRWSTRPGLDVLSAMAVVIFS